MSNILIIDDQPHLKELLAEELMEEGYEIACASDAESVRRSMIDSRPDLVLLDLYLDGFKGWDVLRDIKSRDPLLPVIIVTAYDSFMEDPRVSQANGYVLKSFSHFDELKQKIVKVLRQKPPAESS